MLEGTVALAIIIGLQYLLAWTARESETLEKRGFHMAEDKVWKRFAALIENIL